MQTLPDKDLLTLLRNENSRTQGFNMLVIGYQEKVYRMIRRIVISHEDTDDVVQNVFIKIWYNIGNFREDSKLSTWIYRIAVNESLAFLKTRKFFNFIPFFSVEKKLANSLTDDNYFRADEISLKLQQCILSLPTRQRMVFNMRYYDGLSFEEISSILNISKSALKASYHFAAEKIKKKLSEI